MPVSDPPLKARYVRKAHLVALLGCTRSTIDEWLKEPDFPRPMRPRAAGWRRWPVKEVLAWARRRREEAGHAQAD